MAGKKVPRSLPSLRRMAPQFRGFAPHENQTAALLKILRRIALQLRRPEPHPFYATRDVAEFFRVPRCTVFRIYQRLAAEGLLIRLRSSMTLVQARRTHARVPVRAVVGLPMWLTGFATLQDWREFAVRLEQQLRRHHFVADFVFFQEAEFREPDFADRLIAHQLDYLIWFLPHPLSLPNMLAVADHGVRVVAVVDQPRTLPFPQYVLRYEPAILEGLADWKRDGLATVEVAQHADASAAEVQNMQRLLAKVGLDFFITEFTDTGPLAHPQFITRLGCQRGVGVVFFSDFLFAAHCQGAEAEMLALFQRCRVLVPRGIGIPYRKLQGLRVDITAMEWDKIAARIAEDLAADRVFGNPRPVVFDARWLPRVEAARFGWGA